MDDKYTYTILDTEIPALVTTSKKALVGKTFRRVMEQTLTTYIEVKKDYPHLFWLADISKMAAYKPEDQQWMQENWNPRLNKAGVTHMALILPENIFGQLGIKKYVKANISFVAQLFDDMEKAKSWLKEMKKEIEATI